MGHKIRPQIARPDPSVLSSRTIRGISRRSREIEFDSRGVLFIQANRAQTELFCNLCLLLDIRELREDKTKGSGRAICGRFCDPYTYSGSGLMGLFSCRFGQAPELRRAMEIQLVSYPERPMLTRSQAVSFSRWATPSAPRRAS